VLEKRYLPDSGGPGRHRGGLGQVVRIRKLADDGRPAYAGLFPDGVLTRTAGLFGGRPGGAVRGVLLDAAGVVVADYGVGSLVTLERPDQILELRLAGGAGFGDPRERPLETVQHDLDHGYVTPRGVVEDYGRQVTADGRLVRDAGSPPPGEPAP
jgi:5-oxoprolinase (ATP-hydrolysing)/N-methylhydantoinase A